MMRAGSLHRSRRATRTISSSAFSLDFAYLVERKQLAAAGSYALASVVISLIAVFAGMNLIRTLYAA